MKDDWLIPCQVFTHRSQETLHQYKECIHTWITFKPDDCCPWELAIKEYKDELQNRIITLELNVKRALKTFNLVKFDNVDERDIHFKNIFDDIQDAYTQVLIYHRRVQEKMRYLGQPRGHQEESISDDTDIFPEESISDDTDIFPEEYHTGIVHLKKLGTSIQYAMQLVPAVWEWKNTAIKNAPRVRDTSYDSKLGSLG